MPANVPLTFNQENLYRATTAVPETLRVFAGFIQRTTFYDKLREHIPFGIQIEEKLSMILCTTRIKLRIKKPTLEFHKYLLKDLFSQSILPFFILMPNSRIL